MASATPDPRQPAPVLLIHDLWSTGADWARVAAGLSARGHRCLAPTLPGHTPHPDQPLAVGRYTLADYRVALHAALESWAPTEPPVVIGHGLGGLLAQQLAAERPCRALVLLAPLPPWGQANFTLGGLGMMAPHFGRWRFWERGYLPRAAGFRRTLFNALGEAAQSRLHEGRVHESGRVLSQLCLWWLDPSRASAVPRFAAPPVYLVSAGQDRLVPAQQVRRLRRRYPQARLRHYPERGHWLIDDPHTEEMMNGISSWLRPFERQAISRVSTPQPAGVTA